MEIPGAEYLVPVHFLISLPPCNSGKTSLLLHFAHARAAAGDTVLFVCHRDTIENSPPVLPLGVSLDDEALHRVHMRYGTTPSRCHSCIFPCLQQEGRIRQLPEGFWV